jgi:hypothetical protein
VKRGSPRWAIWLKIYLFFLMELFSPPRIDLFLGHNRRARDVAQPAS